jgi:predicted nucleotidyltransferase
MSKIGRRNSKATEIVWHFLLDNAGEQFYLTQIAQKTNIADSTVQQILEKKVNSGLVEKKKLGNLSLYLLVQENILVRQEKILRTLKLIQPLVDNLKEWSQKIILYGSTAGGQNTATSDIDLFILSNQKDKIWKIFSQSKIKNKVKLVVKNFLEWIQMKDFMGKK